MVYSTVIIVFSYDHIVYTIKKLIHINNIGTIAFVLVKKVIKCSPRRLRADGKTRPVLIQIIILTQRC